MEEHVEHIVWTINGHRHDYRILADQFDPTSTRVLDDP